jgi:hypothetical protein
MRTWHPLPVLTLALSGFLLSGCSTPSKSAPQPQAPAPDSPNDNTNPTAMHLHDLAGELILYQVKTGNLPARLSDLPSSLKATTDPATSQPYRYLSDGPRVPNLPGRILVCQSTPNPSLGRWAILINDYASDGRLITYVQRVDESVFTRLQTGGGW